MHTMVSVGAQFGAAGAGITGFIMDIAVLIEDAVVVQLLQGVEVAFVFVIASNEALLKFGHDEGIHKVALTLDLLVALSSWAPKKRNKASV